MIKRWRQTVKSTDTILHLGDLFFGGQEQYAKFYMDITPQLPGRKFLILGNHDKRKYDFEFLGFEVIEPFEMHYKGFKVTFDHYPKILTKSQRANDKRLHLHGHTHSYGYAHGETERWGNINCCVEVNQYRPQKVTSLLDTAIYKRTRKKAYVNRRPGRRAHN